MESNDKPIVTYNKRAEVQKNRIIIPKNFIDKNGRLFYMEVYKNKIILLPRKEN